MVVIYCYLEKETKNLKFHKNISFDIEMSVSIFKRHSPISATP